MKSKIKIFILTFLLIFPLFNIKTNIKAEEIIYDGDQLDVTVEEFDPAFKGVWVSSLVGFTSFSGIKSYKQAITTVLNNMQKYGYNVMVFHVRIYNDALYESIYCDHSRYYNNNTGWEAIPWIIEECHARGIEFHAWMNPYRCNTSTGLTASQVANKYPALNAAHDPNNLLKGNDYWFMNPGIPEVQDFIVKVCEEFISKFDCDAIHFDDYFYNSGCDDTQTYERYKEGNETKTEFRQNSVSKMIEKLHNSIEKHNKENNKAVKLGISPTPTYRSGDGIVTYDSDGHAITTGANISSYYDNHYNSACADTLKWIQKGWIDYIVPQMYYDDIRFYANCPWWDKVVKYEDCLFVAGLSLNDIRWDYLNDCDNLSGICLFTHRDLENLAKTEEGKAYLSKANSSHKFNKNEIIIDEAPDFNITYEDGAYKIIVENTNNLTNWYMVYRGTNNLSFDESEFIGYLRSDEIGEYSVYTDTIEQNENYVYGVCAVSKSFHYSPGSSKSVKHNDTYLATFIDHNGDIISYNNLKANEKVIYPEYEVEEGKEIKWDKSLETISENTKFTASIVDKQYKIEFVDPDGNVIYTEYHKYNDTLTAPDLPESKKYKYTKWIIDRYYVVKNDDQIQLKYSLINYKVNFYNYYDVIIDTKTYNYGDTIEYPELNEITGYTFVGWDYNDKVTDNHDIKPLYQKIKFNITISNEKGDIILTDTVLYDEDYILTMELELTDDDLNKLKHVKSDVNIIIKEKIEEKEPEIDDPTPIEPVEPEKEPENKPKSTGCNQSIAKILANFVFLSSCLIILIKKKH